MSHHTAQSRAPLEFQVAVKRAFGVHSFIVCRYGNRIMAQTNCKGGSTRTLHDAFLAAVAVSLILCGILF